jgi:hypothetical protein
MLLIKNYVSYNIFTGIFKTNFTRSWWQQAASYQFRETLQTHLNGNNLALDKNFMTTAGVDTIAYNIKVIVLEQHQHLI